MSGLWYVGNTVYTVRLRVRIVRWVMMTLYIYHIQCVVITVNLKLALESQFWPLVNIMILSIMTF